MWRMRTIWRSAYRLGMPALLLLLLAGCQITSSAFEQVASSAGSTFAAAATTLRYVHEGKLTSAYAQSSFVNFAAELGGLDHQLPTKQGAPGSATIRHLLALFQPALQVVRHPCLDSSCNWRAQLSALDAASSAFLKSANA